MSRAQPLGVCEVQTLQLLKRPPQLLAYFFIFVKEITLSILKTPLNNVNLILKLTYINIRSLGKEDREGVVRARKFKIAFSGCKQDCALTPIHDIGLLAAKPVRSHT